MNWTAGMLCSLSRKWLPTAACSTSLTRLAIVPTMLITRGAVVSGTWICTTSSMREDEAFAALGHDLRQPLVELVGLADGLGPVEAQDGRGHLLGFVAAGVDGVLAGPQRLLPDAAMAGPDDRPELEGGPGGVFGRQADVGLDDRHLALLDDQHRDLFHAHQERIEQVRPIEQRVVLEADLAAGLQKGVEVLVVVVLHRLRADQGLDERLIGGVLAFQFLDVVELAQSAGDGAARQRLAFERGDDAAGIDHAAAARRARRDHRNLELLFRQAERLGR